MWQVDPAGSSSVLRRAWSRPQRGGGKVRVGKKGRSTDELKGVRAREEAAALAFLREGQLETFFRVPRIRKPL